MRRLLYAPMFVFGLTVLSSGAMFAQSFTGTWQGALKNPRAPSGELRIVLKISTTADDKLVGEFYSIDQSGPSLPTTALTASSSAIKMTIERLNASYEARMPPDGKTISGTFHQGAALPLDFTRATPETAWTIPEPPHLLKRWIPKPTHLSMWRRSSRPIRIVPAGVSGVISKASSTRRIQPSPIWPGTLSRLT